MLSAFLFSHCAICVLLMSFSRGIDFLFLFAIHLSQSLMWSGAEASSVLILSGAEASSVDAVPIMYT